MSDSWTCETNESAGKGGGNGRPVSRTDETEGKTECGRAAWHAQLASSVSMACRRSCTLVRARASGTGGWRRGHEGCGEAGSGDVPVPARCGPGRLAPPRPTVPDHGSGRAPRMTGHRVLQMRQMADDTIMACHESHRGQAQCLSSSAASRSGAAALERARSWRRGAGAASVAAGAAGCTPLPSTGCSRGTRIEKSFGLPASIWPPSM